MASRRELKKISVTAILILLLGIVVMPMFSGGSINSVQKIFAVSNTRETVSFEEKTYYFTQQFTDINTCDSGNYVTVDVAGVANTVTTPGKPALPVVTKTVEFPLGTTICDVKATIGNTESVHISKPVKPVSQRRWLNEEKQKNSMESSVDYERIDVFPSQLVEYKTGGGLNSNGKHVTFVTFRMYPVKYNVASDTLHAVDQIDVTIDYKKPRYQNIPENNDRQLLIITPSQFVGPLERLAQHKIDMGVSSAVVELSTVYEEADGRDQQEQIKYFIKDWVEQVGVKYVLLVGGIEVPPMRTAAIEFCDRYGIPTDLYYADLYDGEAEFCS